LVKSSKSLRRYPSRSIQVNRPGAPGPRLPLIPDSWADVGPETVPTQELRGLGRPGLTQHELGFGDWGHLDPPGGWGLLSTDDGFDPRDAAQQLPVGLPNVPLRAPLPRLRPALLGRARIMGSSGQSPALISSPGRAPFRGTTLGMEGCQWEQSIAGPLFLHLDKRPPCREHRETGTHPRIWGRRSVEHVEHAGRGSMSSRVTSSSTPNSPCIGT
jgi:hypothetical protein